MASYIRILHASPNTPSVDIYANNMLFAKNVIYREFTPYISVPSGQYNITIFPSGKMSNPILIKKITIPDNSISTVAAVDYLGNLDLMIIPEPSQPIPSNKTMIRFVHLSPNTPSVDITLPNNTKLFEDVSYKEVTDYIPVPAGTYTLEAHPTGDDEVILYVPNIKLKLNRFYTVYAIGLIENKPPLQVLIPLDGNTYLK